ncbi:two-component regulator propeller domain-containing protein [Snuella lapsa]|uniref:histidine kinase n=2 Tax=Snuella lapsa TaxID=870481 RepID=A0ABP6X7W9_9FLAO
MPTCFSIGQSNSYFIKLDRTFNASCNIEEGPLGYLWFINDDGLYKYNGLDYSILRYREIFGEDFNGDSNYKIKKDHHKNLWLYTLKGELTKIDSLGNYSSYKSYISGKDKANYIISISSDDHYTWFGSNKGIIYRYDQKSSEFKKIVDLSTLSLKSTSFFSIAVVNYDQLFFSTSDGLLYRYNLNSGTFQTLNLTENEFNKIDLLNDKLGILWIATYYDGLIKLDVTNNRIIQRYGLFEERDNVNRYAIFRCLHIDNYGTLWAGTDGSGLYKIENDKALIFKKDENNPFTLSDNTVNYISSDSHGNIVLTLKKGIINILPNNLSNISFFSGLKNNAPLNVDVLSSLKSSDGSLWIGTDGKGLNRILPDYTTVQYNKLKSGNLYFKGEYINALQEDPQNIIWIGTYLNGLWVYDPKTNIFKNIEITNLNGTELNDITEIFIDSKKRVWVSSYGCLSIFSENQKLLAKFDYSKHGLFGRASECIIEDENGVIWVGVLDGGLFRFNESSDGLSNSYFTRHNYYIKAVGDNRNYNPKFLSTDNDGSIWISTTSGQVIKFNLKDYTFQNYSRANYLGNYFYFSALAENKDNLWLGSNRGLHHYNLKTNALTSYFEIDGLTGDNFSRHNAAKDKNGLLYFGSEYGVNVINPATINKENINSHIYINEIEILNKPASSILGDPLFKNIVERTTKINVNYDQASFSFRFSAIGNIISSNYHYAYRLKGFDKNWIPARPDRRATYTKIPHGTYIFEVKAGSENGIWDIPPKAITITINPPWWLSNIAYLSYFIIFLLIGYGVYLWIRLKKKLVKEAWENQKEKELYGLKMNFFAKMSHEIQTPLSLILGPIDDMLDRAKSTGNFLLKQRLQIIKNNAHRLSRIASELTTVRNKELDKIRIYATKKDLILHLKEIAESFAEQARFKHIDFIQEYPSEEVTLWYDSDKIEHVFYNLLSNAFKFTPQEGTISLKARLKKEQDSIEITINDSGPGIEKEELQNIFMLFYQSETGKRKKGLGIGLALVKELVALHNGKIKVKSSKEKGTQFKVALSTKENNLREDQKVSITDKVPSLNSSLNLELDGVLMNSSKSIQKPENTLLIVEDNIEMQIFLRDIFHNSYNIIIADDGKQGIALAKKHIPDLIISDVMMPELNGIDMCKKLQKNALTAHIPVILLTARNTTAARLHGLQSGAIEFIQKPFNFNELFIKVNNIINAKNKTLSKYKTELISLPEDSNLQSKDEIFIQRLTEEISKQLDNPDFKLEELANIIDMSYSSIYRKCQEITGKTLIDFYRTLRIKKAALLILKYNYNINEAAFMVSYRDIKYFRKCFKEEFGKTPMALKKDSQKKGLNHVLNEHKIHFSI